MKPPSRPRVKPRRYRLKNEMTVTSEKTKFACSGWSLTEQQVLLQCLKKQNNITAGIHGPIDLDALHKNLPKRSKEEIQSQLEFLMMKVLRSVMFQVRKQRTKQRKAMKPIQLWAELAENMAGVLEEPITTAFAQMLVISATEPGSLTHSDPPRTDYLPKQQQAQFKTIPARPIPKPNSIKKTSLAKEPNSHITLQLRPQGGTDTSNVPSTQQASQLAVTTSSAVASMSVQQKQTPSAAPSSSSRPAAADTSTKPKQPAAAGSSSTMPQHQRTWAGPRTSKYADVNTPRYTGLCCIVDLEKIYRFLSTVHMQSECFKLTPMESAVILDLLMSLPEELPLLDCDRLQHHMLQVHEQLSAVIPKDVRSSHGTGSTQPGAAEERIIGEQRGLGPTDGSEPLVEKKPQIHSAGEALVVPLQTRQIVEKGGYVTGMTDGLGSNWTESALTNHNADAAKTSSGNPVSRCSDSIAPVEGNSNERAGANVLVFSQDKGKSLGQTPPTKHTLSNSGTTDWEKAGLCPLNPFKVPLKLLARRNVQPVEEVSLQ